MFTNVRVAEFDRGLLFRDGRFERVLLPGTHRVWAFPGRVQVHLISLLVPELNAKDALLAILAATSSAEAAALFAVVTCGPEEAAVVFADGMPTAVVRPGTRRVFNRAAAAIEVEAHRPARHPGRAAPPCSLGGRPGPQGRGAGRRPCL